MGKGRSLNWRPLARPTIITPDPIIAAETWLNAIPAATRALADARTAAAEARAAAGWAADGAILLALLKSRALAAAAEWLARRGVRPELADLLLCLAFAAGLEAGRALVGVALGALWPLGARGASAVLAATPAHIVVDAVGALIVTCAARRRPKDWWLILGVGGALMIALAVLVAPVATPTAGRPGQAATAPAGAPLLAFAQKGGLKAQRLYVVEGTDPADVDAEGLGPVARLAVSRAALTAPQPQTYAALGHLLGHHRHGDLWSMTLLLSALTALALFIVAKGAAPLSRALGERALGGAGEPAALPAVGLVLWIFALPAATAFDAFDRVINYAADAYALHLTHDPEGLARWLTATEAGSKADPAWAETVLFYDHPPLRQRLIQAFRRPEGAP